MLLMQQRSKGRKHRRREGLPAVGRGEYPHGVPRARIRLTRDQVLPSAERRVIAFNPLLPRYLGHSISRAFLEQACEPLPPERPFQGAGVYAIYYRGNCPYYRLIAERNQAECKVPIYVGKAVPPGARKGVFVEEPGRALYKRLAEHAESIAEVERNVDPNDQGWLRQQDFRCRFLVVEPVWIPLIESLSITEYRPAWNGLIDGFGHHDQGVTRRTQRRSFWDTLHPGRVWARDFAPNDLNPQAIADILQRWLADPNIALPSRRRRQATSASREIPDPAELEPVELPVEETPG